MDSNKKVVAKIPLAEIWRESEVISNIRLKYLTTEEIRSLLKQGKVQFVVANIGFPLNWISVDNSFDFFKAKLKTKIADKDNESYLENFSENYFYYASIWKSDSEIPIVLLELYH